MAAALSLALACAAEPSRPAGDVLREISDASAAVAIGSTHVVVADDETNVLRAYAIGTWGSPVGRCDLGGGPELDLEGAAPAAFGERGAQAPVFALEPRQPAVGHAGGAACRRRSRTCCMSSQVGRLRAGLRSSAAGW